MQGLMSGAAGHNKKNKQPCPALWLDKKATRRGYGRPTSVRMTWQNTSTTGEKIQRETNTTNSTVEEERHMKYEQQRYARDRANLEPK